MPQVRFIYAISGPVNDIISNTCVCVCTLLDTKKRIDKIKQKKNIFRVCRFFSASIPHRHANVDCIMSIVKQKIKQETRFFRYKSSRIYWKSNRALILQFQCLVEQYWFLRAIVRPNSSTLVPQFLVHFILLNVSLKI